MEHLILGLLYGFLRERDDWEQVAPNYHIARPDWADLRRAMRRHLVQP